MRLRSRNKVCNQAFVARRNFAGHYDAGLHRRMLVENFHNLRWLDAETSNFDLFVNPAQESNLAIGQITRQVTGFVKTRIRIGTERIADESLRG